MKLALGMHDLSEEHLTFARQIGVTHVIAASPPNMTVDGPYFDYERIVQLKARIEGAGLRLAAIQNIPPAWYHAILYGLPGREEQLDYYCRTIENVGRAGIPSCTITFTRSRCGAPARHTRDRGGALVTSYDHALMENAPLAGPRPIDDDELWANYEVSSSASCPWPNRQGVKMALHPDDPPLSPIAGAAPTLPRAWPPSSARWTWCPAPPTACSFARAAMPRCWARACMTPSATLAARARFSMSISATSLGRVTNFRETLHRRGRHRHVQGHAAPTKRWALTAP